MSRKALFLACLVGIAAPQLAAQTTSHYNQLPSVHVMLRYVFDPLPAEVVCPRTYHEQGPLGVERIFPDGTRAAFIIPDGSQLVLTDFQMRATPRSSGTFTKAELSMSLEVFATGISTLLYRSTRLPTQGFSSGNLYLTLEGISRAGLLAGHGTMICPAISFSDTTGFNDTWDLWGFAQGYLIPIDKR